MEAPSGPECILFPLGSCLFECNKIVCFWKFSDLVGVWFVVLGGEISSILHVELLFIVLLPMLTDAMLFCDQSMDCNDISIQSVQDGAQKSEKNIP